MCTKIFSVSRLAKIGFIAALLLFAAGCGDEGSTGSPSTETPVTEITITGDDRMRFSPARFSVRTGDTITLTLHNIGQMPKESMGHNLAILKPGMNINAFAAAAVRHAAQLYIPPEYADQVVAATGVLGPGEKEVITFTAPATPGEYPFVCSFPGHTQAGMRGVMVVLR